MLKVLEPIEAKSVDKVFSNAATTVKMQTNAVIPMAIISTVKMVRSSCVRMELKAILTFSLNSCSMMRVCHEFTIFVTSFFLSRIIYFKNRIFAENRLLVISCRLSVIGSTIKGQTVKPSNNPII